MHAYTHERPHMQLCRYKCRSTCATSCMHNSLAPLPEAIHLLGSVLKILVKHGRRAMQAHEGRGSHSNAHVQRHLQTQTCMHTHMQMHTRTHDTDCVICPHPRPPANTTPIQAQRPLGQIRVRPAARGWCGRGHVRHGAQTESKRRPTEATFARSPHRPPRIRDLVFGQTP